MITITWKQFLTAIFLLTSVYYLVVWLFYYRKDKFRVLIKKPIIQPSIQVMPALAPVEKPVTKAVAINASNSENMGEVHDLTNEIHALVLQLAAQKDDKPTLKKALTKLLHKYPAVTSKTIRTSVELMIAADAENHACIQFTAEELTALWSND